MCKKMQTKKLFHAICSHVDMIHFKNHSGFAFVIKHHITNCDVIGAGRFIISFRNLLNFAPVNGLDM